ncbi:hypothetical protein G8T71_10645 [Clostridium botulinum C/D]|nr:hypothetical protein [Clostridium botulinum C/D]
MGGIIMKKYSNGERKIMATDRAFEVIYKDQGFSPVIDEEKDGDNLDLLKVDELRERAKEKGIEDCENMKKAELISALSED